LAFGYRKPLSFHLTNAQFGSLEVRQDAYMSVKLLVKLDNSFDSLSMYIMGTVAKVQPKNIYTRYYQPLKAFVRTTGRAYGSNDLGILVVGSFHL
jgi:hypothetical protein